ncbi:21251_t:CDS:2 [Dentiscutata erythropus]|uniref:21251_t:CDS:1 n=1 Tax=Dentiscutata erythropus TaxID=1348616 RepID=A0A9N8VP72_9GLOM|nr:21251_t:CDS:2 [Dentiscutata erythropus]
MSNNKRAKYSNFQKTRDKMPKSKINHGPCSIYNCDKSSNDFRCLSNLAIRKASAKGNLRLYPYLQPGYQICSPHYTAIVENQLPEPTSAPAQAFIPTTLPVKPSIELLLTPTEFSQSDNELPNYYKTSDDYETTDDEHLNNESVVSQEHVSKKKRNCGMNLKTTLEKKHLKYIERVGGFAVSGGAPLVKIVAQELFPDKFTENTKFSYSKLSSNQSKRLNDELSTRSKWKIDQKCLCIHSSVCEIYTDQIERLCAKCILLTKDPNALSKPMPKPENRRFTPKFYFRNNLILKFLGNLHIKELWTSISNTNENNSALASKSGECMSDTSICLENMACFKRLADSMNYKGPVIAMTDNTKVYPRLGYFANLGCIIGSVFSLDQTMVNDYNEAESVIQNIISNNAIAKQVRLYLLQNLLRIIVHSEVEKD